MNAGALVRSSLLVSTAGVLRSTVPPSSLSETSRSFNKSLQREKNRGKVICIHAPFFVVFVWEEIYLHWFPLPSIIRRKRLNHLIIWFLWESCKHFKRNSVHSRTFSISTQKPYVESEQAYPHKSVPWIVVFQSARFEVLEVWYPISHVYVSLIAKFHRHYRRTLNWPMLKTAAASSVPHWSA